MTRPPKLSLRDLAKPPPTAAPATPQELAREAQARTRDRLQALRDTLARQAKG